MRPGQRTHKSHPGRSTGNKVIFYFGPAFLFSNSQVVNYPFVAETFMLTTSFSLALLSHFAYPINTNPRNLLSISNLFSALLRLPQPSSSLDPPITVMMFQIHDRALIRTGVATPPAGIKFRLPRTAPDLRRCSRNRASEMNTCLYISLAYMTSGMRIRTFCSSDDF